MQTRKMSALESIANVAIGYGISVTTNALLLPLFGLHPTLSDNFLIGGVFTVISLLRSYVLRRFFNRKLSWLEYGEN